MRHSRHILFAAALAGILLAACGEVPHPFQTGDAIPPTSIEEARDFEGISVELVQGAPEHVALPLAEAISNVLQGVGVPATASDKFHGRFSLRGFAVNPGPPTAARPHPIADVTWRLIDRSGKPLVEFLQRINGPSDGWQRGDQAMLDRIAQDVTPAVVDTYHAVAERDRAPADSNWTTISLTALNGLNGENNEIMVRAIRYALSERGMAPVQQAKAANYALIGAFDIGPPQGGRRAVAITWTVNAKDGKELGKVNQRNFLPDPMSGALWRQISAAIAAGAGDGIADLLHRTGGS